MVIWLVLILALAIPKANRNIHVLWIAAPLVVLNLLYFAFKKISGMPSSAALQYDILFQSMLIGISVLWLMANYLPKFGGAIRFLLSFGTVVIVAGLGTLSYSTEFSNETAMFLVLFIFVALTLLVAMTLSRRLCGGKYRPVCFMLWLALWILLSSLVAMFGFIIVGSIIMSGGPDFSEPNLILMLIMSGFVFGLFLYALNFPFMILGFVNPFFRERFCACLRLKAVSAAPKQADIDLINEQNPGTKIPEKGDSG
ncbi:MAG: hypothetical protein ACYS3S_03050 [Planctomycetota bacterium]